MKGRFNDAWNNAKDTVTDKHWLIDKGVGILAAAGTSVLHQLSAVPDSSWWEQGNFAGLQHTMLYLRTKNAVKACPSTSWELLKRKEWAFLPEACAEEA